MNFKIINKHEDINNENQSTSFYMIATLLFNELILEAKNSEDFLEIFQTKRLHNFIS